MKVVEEVKVVKEVEDKLASCPKNAEEMQAYINIAYYAGKQWIAWDKNQKKLYEPPREPYRVRFVGNRVQPIVRTELAKITKNKPIVNCIPASSDDDDIKSARLGDKIIEWLFYELRLQKANRKIGLWGLTTGIGGMKPFWNPSKGESIPDEKGNLIKLGDVDYDIWSIFDIRWDTSAKEWNEIKWIAHEKVRTIDYVKEVYGQTAKNIDELKPENNVLSNNLDLQLQGMNTLGNVQKPVENSVIVKEYWEKPSNKYPKGRRITIANGILLFYSEDIGFGEKDETERELPFFPFFHIIIPGKVISQSVIENLIPVQREYNKTRSQIIENKNLMTYPKILIEEGSTDDDPTNEPGQILRYKKGFNKPEMLYPPSISSDAQNNIEMCKEEFEFISGQHEVSHGNAPSGVKSGVAIGFLQEQDDTKLSPTISNYEECIEQYCSYFLKMIKHNYTEERVIKIVGENKSVVTETFKGSDLTSTDVRCQAGSSLPMGKAAKQDWVMNLIDRGVLNPVQDRNLIIKMLELGITDEMYDNYSMDVNQAQNEILRWKKGDFSTEVRDFQMHEIHIQEHDKFRKSDEYEELPMEIQDIIDMHVEEHKNYLLQSVIPPMNPNMPPTDPIEEQNPMLP